MSDNPDTPRSDGDDQLEREIRKERKFTLEEAIGRMLGPGAIKGASPVTRKEQAEVEIENWLTQHLSSTQGELQVVLLRCIKQSEVLLSHYDRPLGALAGYCQQVLGSDYALKELVRDADMEWGRVLGERPFFETQGSAPNPDDPYTLESVRSVL